MTKQEAVNVLDGFRKAFKALKPMEAMQAFNSLTDTGKMTSDFNLAMEFSKSLNALRSVFEALERKGIEFSSR